MWVGGGVGPLGLAAPLAPKHSPLPPLFQEASADAPLAGGRAGVGRPGRETGTSGALVTSVHAMEEAWGGHTNPYS